MAHLSLCVLNDACLLAHMLLRGALISDVIIMFVFLKIIFSATLRGYNIICIFPPCPTHKVNSFRGIVLPLTPGSWLTVNHTSFIDSLYSSKGLHRDKIVSCKTPKVISSLYDCEECLALHLLKRLVIEVR